MRSASSPSSSYFIVVTTADGSRKDGHPRRFDAAVDDVADAFVDVRARAVGVCVHRNRVSVCVDVGTMSTTRVRARCVEETGE